MPRKRTTGGLGGQAGRRQTRVRAAPLPPLLVTPLINHKHKITNTMAGGGRVVAAGGFSVQFELGRGREHREAVAVVVASVLP